MRHTTFAIIFGAMTIASCGGASAPPRSLDVVSSPDSALAVLDSAEAEIMRTLGAIQSSAAPPPPPPVTPTAPQQAPIERLPGLAPPADAPRKTAVAQKAAPAPHDDAHDQDRNRVAQDTCSMVCAALASMERAATHLCDVAGSNDARCTSARDRVKAAAARVHAACPSCAR